MADQIRQTLVAQKLIIVDAEEDLVLDLQETLNYRGFQVILTADADNLAKVVLAAKVELILINVDLPNYAGFKALRFLRLHEETRSMPVIAISPKPEHMKISLQLGASDFLQKKEDIVERATELIEKFLIHLNARRNMSME